jgi:hypothetical protein
LREDLSTGTAANAGEIERTRRRKHRVWHLRRPRNENSNITREGIMMNLYYYKLGVLGLIAFWAALVTWLQSQDGHDHKHDGRK